MKNGHKMTTYGLTMLVAVIFGMGPTVGDIGSCGQAVDPLDAPTFFDIKANLDCRRCGECALGGTLCNTACTSPAPTTFPRGCQPLVHDGEVCLYALAHASCADYAAYMSDAAPTAPTECRFCPQP